MIDTTYEKVQEEYRKGYSTEHAGRNGKQFYESNLIEQRGLLVRRGQFQEVLAQAVNEGDANEDHVQELENLGRPVVSERSAFNGAS
jgi:hypothetical protein